MLESAKSHHQRSLDGISQLQAQMTFRFSVLSKLLDRQMTEIAAKFGLSLIGYRTLATINAFEEATAADLVRYTGYDKAAISRSIKDLTANTLIDVRTDPHHGRRKILTVTPSGTDLIASAAPFVDARRENLSAQLTGDEEAVFLRAIEKLASHISHELTTSDR